MRKSQVIFAAAFIVLVFAAWPIQAESQEIDGSAWIGIYTQSIDETLREAFDLKSDKGVIINKVVPDSPAEKAGLDEGDIILKIGDHEILDSDDLAKQVRKYEPDDKVYVDIIRDGRKDQIEVTLGEREDYGDTFNQFDWTRPYDSKKYSKSYTWLNEKVSDVYLGVNLESLNSQLGEYFGVKDGKGALITEVMDDSPAKKTDLRAGDVIIEMAGEEIASPTEVIKALNDREEGDQIEIVFLRDRQEKQFTVTLEKRPDSFYSFRKPDIPLFDFDQMLVPRMKGLFHGDFFDDDNRYDRDDYDNMFDDLRQEIEKLKKEIQELKSERN